MNRALSQKMRFLTFISIALLGFVHGYNLEAPYLSPWSTVDEPLTLTTFTEYFLSNGLLRFRIPLLFLISGYLYAQYDDKPYVERMKKRFNTLMIPYLLWSAFGLLLTFALQQFPVTARIVFQTQLDQLGDNRPYTEIGWQGMLVRWLLVPVSFQLWFIGTLFIYNALYPAMRFMLRTIPLVWLGITFVLWFSFFNVHYIEGQGLFFFSLGVWIQKRQWPIAKEPAWFSLGLAWIFFIGVCCIKTFMAFELPKDSWTTWITLSVLYQLATVSGLLAVWFGADRAAAWWMAQEPLRQVSGFAFIIYGMHTPLLQYTMTAVLMAGAGFAYIRLTAYLLVPVCIMLVCIGVARLLHRYMPRMYSLLTGGRGF